MGFKEEHRLLQIVNTQQAYIAHMDAHLESLVETIEGLTDLCHAVVRRLQYIEELAGLHTDPTPVNTRKLEVVK